MTHQLPGFKVKVLTDEHDERWYLFFNTTVTDPFLFLPEYDMKALAGIVELETKQAAALEAAEKEERDG